MVALSLLEAQSKGTLSMGRIVPWYIKFFVYFSLKNYFKIFYFFIKIGKTYF